MRFSDIPAKIGLILLLALLLLVLVLSVGRHTIIPETGPTEGATATGDPQSGQPTVEPAVEPGGQPAEDQPAANLEISAGPTIREITTNLGGYPAGLVPRYEKLEITFQVDTVAENLQLPFDAAPPPGIAAGLGISVDALFSPDGWNTVYSIPAFYYQEFLDEVKGGSEWFYPTENTSWKVRFAPNQVGDWQFKLVAQDASGATETVPYTFTVRPSANKGFLRVSQRDPRYFEFEDGTYFPALGYNMNFNKVSWNNPVLGNEKNFAAMAENGIQLIRLWLSQWGIYGPSWNPWNSIIPEHHSRYIPYLGVTFREAYGSSEVSMRVAEDANPCMFIGFMKATPAVKQDTTYRVRIRYKTEDIAGPRLSGKPYGFVAKTGSWLWGDTGRCNDAGSGTLVTPHVSQNTSDWQILEGKISIGDRDYLPNFYLVMENAAAGRAFIDYVWIEEELGGGKYGPNILPKPWMAHHLYMEQRNSYAFDKMLELAEQYGIYLRPVIMEKNEWIFNRIDYQGNYTNETKVNDYFYGNGREMTKVRWLQQAWWRYVQARWGYSPNIHSYELINEGDPASERHFILADEFGKYMRQFKPNDHLVSTSTWHSFPSKQFWASEKYPHVDFADVHYYIQSDDKYFGDSAMATYDMSMRYGARQPDGAGKPVIRGETGFVGSSGPSGTFKNDVNGLWLHNFIWGGINAGGLIESYWYENSHIYKTNSDGSGFDHRERFRAYYNFISRIPLNSGHYQDAQAALSDGNLRAWGQKDLVAERAHLWIHNKDNTWLNASNGASIKAVSGQVTVAGFQPGKSYTVQWWDTRQSDPAKQITASETAVADGSGAITLRVDGLVSDVAVQIFTEHSIYLPTALSGVRP
jgi:hypothetical protein